MPESTANSYIYGIHTVHSVLQKDITSVRELWFADSVQNNKRIKQIREIADSVALPISTASYQELDALTNGAKHQGVVVLCGKTAQLKEKDLESLIGSLDQAAFFLVLDGVQDPHNLGACIRTADAAGVQAVIAPKDRAVGITSVVRKVASGAAEHVPFFQVTNLARTLKMLKDQGIWVIGADQPGTTDLFAADLSGPIALVLGAEGKGLRRLTREHCDLLISIPMTGSVESLNVSVAAGVCLYEIKRQRNK